MLGFIRAFDRCDGRLALTEQRVAPGVLLDAFEAISYAHGLRAWQRAKDEAAQWQRKPGTR